jgi:hypothetical protein
MADVTYALHLCSIQYTVTLHRYSTYYQRKIFLMKKRNKWALALQSKIFAKRVVPDKKKKRDKRKCRKNK